MKQTNKQNQTEWTAYTHIHIPQIHAKAQAERELQLLLEL